MHTQWNSPGRWEKQASASIDLSRHDTCTVAGLLTVEGSKWQTSMPNIRFDEHKEFRRQCNPNVNKYTHASETSVFHCLLYSVPLAALIVEGIATMQKGYYTFLNPIRK